MSTVEETPAPEMRVPTGLRPGQFVIACRCGTALSAGDMRQLYPKRAWPINHRILPRIVCPDCALKAAS